MNTDIEQIHVLAYTFDVDDFRVQSRNVNGTKRDRKWPPTPASLDSVVPPSPESPDYQALRPTPEYHYCPCSTASMGLKLTFHFELKKLFFITLKTQNLVFNNSKITNPTLQRPNIQHYKTTNPTKLQI